MSWENEPAPPEIPKPLIFKAKSEIDIYTSKLFAILKWKKKNPQFVFSRERRINATDLLKQQELDVYLIYIYINT